MTATARDRVTARRRLWLLGPPVLLLTLKGVGAIATAVGPMATAGRAGAVIELTLGAMAIIAALALIAGRRIGWILALSIVGWDLAALIVLWWVGSPNFLSMALVALSAALITSPDMRTLFAAADRS